MIIIIVRMRYNKVIKLLILITEKSNDFSRNMGPERWATDINFLQSLMQQFGYGMSNFYLLAC